MLHAYACFSTLLKNRRVVGLSMSNSSEQVVASMAIALAIVTARYTRSDERQPRCPLSFQKLCHGSKMSSFHFCHILPKCFEESICVRLSDNANNIFPSTELIHKNMELYQSIPNMTVKFERRFNDHFDEYIIVFSPKLPLLNELRASIGAIDAQPRRVLFATGSRPFFDLHHRAFQEHHKSVVPAMSRFDELVSQQLFSHVMLHSATMKDNRNQVKSRKQTSSGFQVAVRDDDCNLPQMGLSLEAAKRLVDTIFQISSTFFENWKVAERIMPAWIICHHRDRRTFKIGFRPECGPLVNAEEFKQGFHDDPTHEVWLVSEASLLEYGMLDQVKQIPKKPIVGDLPAAKQLVEYRNRESSADSPNKPRRRKASKKTITQNEDHEEVTAVHSTDECVGTSIAVYWPKGGGGSWQEGEIIAKDGDQVQVRYTDSTEPWSHNLAEIKYKIVPSQTHANHSMIWECTGCGCHNKTGSAPTARSSCINCKREYGLLGVLLGEKRRRTAASYVEKKIESKPRRQEGSTDNVCSPAVQMHSSTDQRVELPSDTESLFVASNHASVHANNGTCGTFGDDSDDASRGTCSILPGEYNVVAPLDELDQLAASHFSQ